MKKGSQNTSIRVFCRLRPLNKLEMSQGGECCVEYTEKNIKVKVAGEEKPYDFAFDGIFGPETAQVDVFNKVAKPVIDRLMEGYNGTLFAYGQTSSGKTFTMEGPDIIDSDDKKGIIPRMMSHLFNLILNSSENIEFNVKVSFLELYNEKLQDLLDPRKNNLQIKEDKNKGIFIQDATEIYVASAEQMRQVHKSGSDNRTVAATRMNERSSRSHSIFVLQVIQKDIKTEATKSSKLYFVDLAGSEKISKTNVTGQQLEEAKNINKSLTTLGMVINALTEKDKSHIPYRDSKLTRLLQESLGGNSQTSLVLACSMCSYNDKETLGTLRFGNRAKSVKNAPVVNVERSVKELTILLEQAERKIREQDDIIQNLQQQMDTGVMSAHTSFLEPVPNNIEKLESMLETVEEKPETPVSIQAQPFSFQIPSQIPSQIPITEEKIPPRHERHQSKASISIDAGAGSASLTLLKQHIQIVNLTEELQALKLAHKELENELSNKTQECYDLIGKTMQYENQIQEVTTKTFSKNEEYQVKMEKLCNENQANGVLMNKFKRAINRLKSDLNFAFISKNLKMLEGDDKFNRSQMHDESQSQDFQNKEDLIVNSIQKTIEMLEEIEKDIDERDEKPSYMNEVEEIMESFGINKSQKVRRSTATKPNEPGSGNSKTNPAESVTTGTDEEIKATTIATEESAGETAREHLTTENFDSIKIDFENEDDLMQKIQLQSLTEEEKITELQNLITSQRKTITNLSKMNNELTHANHKHQATQDKKIQSYKIKIEDLQKFNAEKAKEYERKIQSLKTLLEEKIKELEETKKKQDEELLNKAKLLSDLKFQNDRMQKIILGNDLAKRVYELETKVKELTLERQKLFEDLFKLRAEVDEKDELVTDKNAQIQILQVGLNTLSSELEILKHLRPQQGQNAIIKKDKKEGGDSQKNKKEKIFFDKHVVKPIRGGGGNVKNFERDNYLIFEKPSMLESSDLRSNPRNAEKTGRHEAGSSADSRLGKDSFKKFDEMMKSKKDFGDGRPRGKSPLSIRTMEEEEDEPNIEAVKEKLKVYSTKHKDEGQKKTKGFFSGVKNLFS